MLSLFDPVKVHSRLTDTVIVSYSGGKDSAVVLDIACRYFKRVYAFFMYHVPALSFQEATIRWAEEKYSILIYRVPHFELSDFYRMGLFCRFDGSVPLVRITDIYAHVRAEFCARWIVAGERAADSVVRGAMIKRSGSVDLVRERFFPLAYWTKADVLKYIAHHNLKVSPESRVLGHSFRSMQPGDMLKLRDHHPADYERLAKFFPLLGAAVMRAQLYGEDVNLQKRSEG